MLPSLPVELTAKRQDLERLFAHGFSQSWANPCSLSLLSMVEASRFGVGVDGLVWSIKPIS